VDFGEYKQWQPFAAAALELSLESLSDKKQEDWEAYQQIYKECETKWNEELGKLNLITSDNFPEKPIYRYHIRIIFPGLDGKYYDETVETIDVLIQGERHTVDVGQWRFHSQLPDDLTEALNTFLENRNPNTSNVRTVTRVNPYNGGYTYCTGAYVFKAEQDMTLLGIEQVFGGEKPINLIGAKVTVNGFERFWDLERPMEVSKGDEIKIDLYFRDEMFEKIYSKACTTYRLDCQIRQEIVPKLTFINMGSHILGAYGMYLMAFEGVDLSNYFYWNFEDENLDAMPEEWRS